MRVKTILSLGITTLMAVVLTANAQAQVRGEVQGFGTGQIRKVHQTVKAPTAPDVVTNEPDHNPEWVRVAEMMSKYTPRFQYGVRGGISALKLVNSEEIDGKGLAGGMLAILNSSKYIYQNTPRSQRQNRVSWNLTAFGRFNFGGGMGNIQLELNYAENRYETAVVNQNGTPTNLSRQERSMTAVSIFLCCLVGNTRFSDCTLVPRSVYIPTTKHTIWVRRTSKTRTA